MSHEENTHQEKYDIEKEIARGSMGAILKAYDTTLHRDVAMKVILANDQPKARKKFLDEARITGQLEHPNIIPVHELGTDSKGHAYFTMKMVHGKSMAEVFTQIKENTKVTTTRSSLLNIFINVCNAIDFAHSKGVVHCDLKPANIMLGDFGEAMVMDWGVARVMTEDKGENQLSGQLYQFEDENNKAKRRITGTPSYMSPEQARGQIGEIDRRSDIYSLGTILYEILTLSTPYRGKAKDAKGVLKMVVTGKITAPHLKEPGRNIPIELSAITMKALALEKDDRYPNIKAFIEDIQLHLDGHAVSAKNDNYYESVVKLIKRNKASTLGVAGFIIALSAGLIFSMISLSEANLARAQAESESARALAAEAEMKKTHEALTEALIKAETETEKSREAQEIASVANREAKEALLHAEQEKQNAISARDDAKENAEKLHLEKHARRKERMASAPAYLENALKGASMKDFKKAIKDVNQALELNPKLGKARMLKAQLLIADKKYKEAILELKVYLETQPEDTLAQDLKTLCSKSDTLSEDILREGLSKVFAQQKAYLFVNETKMSPEEKLKILRGRLNQAWPGSGTGLSPSEDDGFDLDLSGNSGIISLSPLKGMGIKSLNISRTGVVDLSPLTGSPLEHLRMRETGVTDLQPLRSLPLTFLDASENNITDIGPLTDSPITHLNLGDTQIDSLGPISEKPLVELDISNTLIESLVSVSQSNLKRLNIAHTRISDLSHLQDQSLEILNMNGTMVSEVDLLNLDSLKELHMVGTDVVDLNPLRSAKNLERLSYSPNQVKGGRGAIKMIASLKKVCADENPDHFLSPQDFIENKVRKKKVTTVSLNRALSQANPKYRGSARFSEARGHVVSMVFDRRDNIHDISPLEGVSLTRLEIYASVKSGLEALRGMPLQKFILQRSENLFSLNALEDSRLTHLELHHAKQLGSIKALAGQKIKTLILTSAAELEDLSPLKGMPIHTLTLSGLSKVKSLKVLEGMPLRSLNLSRLHKVRKSYALSLRSLNLYSLNINSWGRLKSLSFLKDSQLSSLEASEMQDLSSLSLYNLNKLRTLKIEGNLNLSKISTLSNVKLSSLNMNYCDGVKSLKPLANQPFRHLEIAFCQVKGLKKALLTLDQIDPKTNPWIPYLAGESDFEEMELRIKKDLPHLSQFIPVYEAMSCEMSKSREQRARAVEIYEELSHHRSRQFVRCAKNRLAKLGKI